MAASPVKVLCLGMPNDIMTPLNLVPNLDILYIIHKIGEDEDRRSEIDNMIATMRTGKKMANMDPNIDDTEPYDRFLTGLKVKWPERASIHYLSQGKCDILANAIHRERDQGIGWNWRVLFKYGRKNRVLMRFEQDPMDEWPAAITGVTHVIVGSFALVNDIYVARLLNKNNNKGAAMLATRTHPSGFTFYGPSLTHAFPSHTVVDQGTNPRGLPFGHAFVKKGTDIDDWAETAHDIQMGIVNFTVLRTGDTFPLAWKRAQ